MPGDLAGQLKKRKIITVSLLIAFVVLCTSTAVLACSVPELKRDSLYVEHEPLAISGDEGIFGLGELVSGGGTQMDPFLIEGLSFDVGLSPGISVNETDSFLLIRNCSFSGPEPILYQSDLDYVTEGILLSNASDVRIENCYFEGLSVGIRVEGGDAERPADVMITRCVFSRCLEGIRCSSLIQSVIEHCHMESISFCPVQLNRCDDIELENSYVNGFGVDLGHIERALLTTYGAIVISNCTNVSISENFIWGRMSGHSKSPGWIEVNNSARISLKNNTIGDLGGYNIAAKVMRSSLVSITDNDLRWSARIRLSDSSECSIGRNNLSQTENAAGYLGAIIGHNLSSSVIFGNTIDRGSGIYLDFADGCTIEGNVLTNCGDSDEGIGISVSGASSCISRNLVLNGRHGITVGGSNITVSGNIVSGIQAGFYHSALLRGSACSQLKVVNNNISYNSYWPPYGSVFIEYSSDVTVAGNRIDSWVAILDVDQLWISNNTFTELCTLSLDNHIGLVGEIVHNSFLGASVEFQSAQAFSWNDSYPVGGNFWSAYTGKDEFNGPGQNLSGSDGIGDVPYPMGYSNIDYYPLMSPIEPPDDNPPITHAFTTGIKGNCGWYRSRLDVTLLARDNQVGVLNTLYRLDEGDWESFEAPLQVIGDGAHVLQFFSVDRAGNTENIHTVVMNIDSQPPLPNDDLALSYTFRDTLSVIIPVGFSDALSGVRYVSVTPSIDNIKLGNMSELLVGVNALLSIDVSATDIAGNYNSVTIYVDSRINFDRDPFSPEGPYGPFLLVAMFWTLVILIALVSSARRLRRAQFSYKSQGFKEIGEVDKEVDVVDGNPKYHRKI